ncbi:MAG: hypothetical protein J2P54_01985, partial [Bradyrhizobiaceae bacterium]|nr:hypothetical protein [Bradyrhizobiaceae bacterium]
MLLKNVSLGMNSYVRFLDQMQFKQLSEIEHDTIIATERYTLDISLYELACSIATAFRQAGGAQARVQGDASNAVFVICENKRLWAYVSKGEGSRPLDKIRSSH